MESGIFAAGLMSLVLGGAMTMFGWKAVRQNRRREVARTTLLSQLAFPGGMPAAAVADLPADAGGQFGIDEFRSEGSVAMETLFSEPEPSGTASRRTAALAAIGVTLAIVIGSSWWLASAGSSAPAETNVTAGADAPASATTVSVPSPVVQAPSRLELLSLTHRATPAAFVVTGQVRNPSGDAPLDDVVAVVEVMDSAGRVLMTVRTPLKRSGSGNNELSEFSAAAAKATTVARYRVEFQDSARTVIPHFDRRPQSANSRPR